MNDNTKLRFNSSEIANLGDVHRFNLIIENLSDGSLTIQIPSNLLKRRIMLNDNNSVPVDINQSIYCLEIERGEHCLLSLLDIKLSSITNLIELGSVYYEFDLKLFKHENSTILDKICIAKSYVDILQLQHINPNDSTDIFPVRTIQPLSLKSIMLGAGVICALFLLNKHFPDKNDI